jgi:ParB-like chromosome segregation protein Spo0J
MEKYGLLKPIKVVKEKNRYKIIDGFLRFLAWKILYDDKPIPSIILNKYEKT